MRETISRKEGGEGQRDTQCPLLAYSCVLMGIDTCLCVHTQNQWSGILCKTRKRNIDFNNKKNKGALGKDLNWHFINKIKIKLV